MKNPVFVITGAPNKGKSTFVKAMTNDPGIEIGEISRTTELSKAYHFRLGKEEGELFTLWDTPGFENSAEAYEIISGWVQENPDEPLQAFRRYVDTYKGNPEHKYEVEIFKPLIPFACIVYIADCSKSFSKEDYLREIELLKLTNLPRIAILNPIEGDRHLDSWRRGLNEYFNNTKVFNPHKTTFDEKISILGAFSHLHDEWEQPINRLIAALREEREQVLEESARIIRSTVLKIYDTGFEVEFDDTKSEEENRELLLKKVRDFVVKTMNKSQEEIAGKFGLDVEIDMKQEFHPNDLFHDTVRRQNLSNHQRGMIGGVTGAAVGAGADVVLGGLTFGVLTAAGGVGGYVAGYASNLDPYDLVDVKNIFGTEKKRKLEVKSLSTELGFLMINRLRQVVSSLYNRSIVNREKIIIDKDTGKQDLVQITKLLNQIATSQKHRYSETKKKELLDFIHKKLAEDQEKANSI